MVLELNRSFNNDNRKDIVTVNSGTDSISILLRSGNGSFTLMITYSVGNSFNPYAAAVGDFNNDGQVDIVVTITGASTAGVFLGYGNGTFATPVIYSTSYQSLPYWIITGDFNNDNQSDLATANFNSNNVGILLGRGGFNTMITYSTGVGSAPYSIAIGEFNNDTRSDFLVTNAETVTVAVFLGHGNGTFPIPVMYSTGARSGPYTVAIGDSDNNNRLDLVMANSRTSNIFILYGYQNGSFGVTTSYTLGYDYDPYSVAVTDLNQDGWMDIVIACYGTDSITTLVKMC